MKKINNILILLCVLWFVICQGIDFSFSFINNIHSDMTCINISGFSKKEDAIGLLDFVKEEETFAFCENTNFITANVIGYKIYATDVVKAVSKGMDNERLQFNYSTASNYRKSNNIYSIKRPSILCRMDIYNFGDIEASEYGYQNHKYYIEKTKVDKVITYLTSKGYTVSIIDNMTGNVFRTQSWSKEQFLMILFISISLFIRHINGSRIISICKLNGYSDNDVAVQESKKTLKYLIICTFVVFLSCTILLEIISGCGIGFIAYSLKNIVLLNIIIILTSVLSPLIVAKFFCPITSIKRRRSKVVIRLLSIAMVGAATFINLHYSANAYMFITQANMLYRHRDDIGNEDIYSLCFNESSTDFNANYDELSSRCEKLYEYLYRNNKIVFSHVELYDDGNQVIIYVNNNFLKLLHNNNYLNGIYDDLSHSMILILPKNLNSLYIQDLKDAFPEAKCQVYEDDITVPALSPSLENRKGVFKNPILLVMNDPLSLGGNPLTIMNSNSFFLWDSKHHIQEVLKENGLDTVVSNIKSVNDLYVEEFENSIIFLLEALFQLVFYYILFSVIAIYYISVCFESDKKIIGIEYLFGYSSIEMLSAYIIEFLIIGSIYFLLFDTSLVTIILLLSYDIYFMVCFAFEWKKYRAKKLVNILKGEEL